jgi:predicted nucleic acid-binding protein
MARQVFVDTSAFYALMIKNDDAHNKMLSALDEVRSGKARWLTSDYILDETATLLMARGHQVPAEKVLELVSGSRVMDIQWMDSQRFLQSRMLFSKYREHHVSFTDCFSFALMRELDVSDVLTKDSHFGIMGFHVLLK